MSVQDKLIDQDDNQIRVEIAEDSVIAQAQNSIYRNFGDRVSVTQKGKSLYKFGRNPNIGTSAETVWQVGGDETYCTTNAIDKFSSSNAGDTQEIVIEGHTISGGVLTFATQTVTLVGQTETALTTPLARVTRLYNNGTVDFAGDIYVYENDTVTSGVPQTTSKIHLKVPVNGNQSEKAATSISNEDYYIITQFIGYCFTKASRTVEFLGEMREVDTTNKVFRRQFSTAGSEGQPTVVNFNPPFIVPKNYDLRVRAVASASSTDIGASFNGYIAKIIN